MPQRQLFLIDHAGLPLPTVIEQLEILGGGIGPPCGASSRSTAPAHVPDAPTHASLKAATTATADLVGATEETR